ncbi:MAG: hypothetical protein JNL38_08475, partial [Myxococcales bacterium]|nr:hypothetical protein [Myxococcales bacterium]
MEYLGPDGPASRTVPAPASTEARGLPASGPASGSPAAFGAAECGLPRPASGGSALAMGESTTGGAVVAALGAPTRVVADTAG